MGATINPFVIKKGSKEPTANAHKVTTIDPFGIVNEQWVEHGTNGKPPTPKIYEFLTFYEFNGSFDNVTEDRVIGTIYNTIDGKTYAFLTVNANTGLSVTLYLNKTDGSILTIDWNDSTQSTLSGSGLKTVSHTFPSVGNYIVTLWISTGSGYFQFGRDNTAYVFVGGANQNMRNMLTKLYIGNKVNSITIQGLYCCNSLKVLSISNGLISIGQSAFESCYDLEYLCISNTVTGIGSNAFSTCSSLFIVSMANSVTNIEPFSFYYCTALSMISISNNITSLPSYIFNSCYSLKSISIPTSVTSIASSAFSNCYSIKSIVIPSTMTSIASGAFSYCYALLIIKIYATTPPNLASTSAFSGLNIICKFYVPTASLSVYKTATNWVTYANYIYPLSDIGE